MKKYLTHEEVDDAARRVARLVALDYVPVKIYGVPRGGIPVAYAIAHAIQRTDGHATVVGKAEDADDIVDDLIDSGETARRYQREYPNKPFHVLFDKRNRTTADAPWYVFPWECSTEGTDESFTNNVTRLLQYVGENPRRGGLLETPARVAKAWKFWCSGYEQKPEDVLKLFEDGGEKHDQMITVKDFPIYSHCEHHLAAIFGTCTISYIPNGKIVGLSKLPRLAAVFSRRLQVQERMTDQIADAFFDIVEPLGVGVVIKARHMCMESRGVCQQGHHTITTALRGVIKDQPLARAEFMRMV
jgi:GTP cyclohydrolase I